MMWIRLQGASSRLGGGVFASRNTASAAALKCLRGMAVAVLAWAGTAGQAAAQSIESVMREMQARQKVVNPANPLKWPRCTCDDIEAPPYPPEGFYGSQMTDPRRAAELVGYVRLQFLFEAQWRKFVREEVGEGLEGQAVNWVELFPVQGQPAQWVYGDGVGKGGIWYEVGVPSNPTVENYTDVLKRISDAIEKLHYQELPADLDMTMTAVVPNDCGGPFSSCDAWVECVKEEIEQSDEWVGGATHLPSTSLPALTLIGSEEALYLNMDMSACGVNENCATCTSMVPTVGSAAFSANKGTFSYDVGNYEGTGNLYVMAIGFNSGDGSNSPPCETDELYHSVTSFGGAQNWSHTIGEMFEPKMTLQCSDWVTGGIVTGAACERACFRGWAITETHVIFDHQFVTTPSVAAPCGGGGGGCSSCGGSGDATTPGQLTVAHDSMHLSIGLGNSYTGKRAAALNTDVPDLLSADAYLAATQFGMQFRDSGLASGVDVVGTVTVPPSPQYPLGMTGLSLIAFPGGQVALDQDNGQSYRSLLITFSMFSGPDGEPIPYKLIRVTYDRDDTLTPPVASFTIREMFGADETTTNYRETIITQSGRRSDSSTCTSTMITGAGFEQHADEIHYSALNANGERTETRTLRSNGGVPVRQTVTTYTRFSWGEEVTKIVEGAAGSDTRTQLFTYVTTGAARGRLASETTSDGGLTTYTYNTQGLLSEVHSPYLDNVAGSGHDRVDEYRYHYDLKFNTLVGTKDVVVEHIERVDGHEIARTYIIYWMRPEDCSNGIALGCPTGGGGTGGYAGGNPRETTTIVSGVLGDQDLQSFLTEILRDPYSGVHSVTHTAVNSEGVSPFSGGDDGRLIWSISPDGRYTRHTAVQETHGDYGTVFKETTTEGLLTNACLADPTSPIHRLKFSTGDVVTTTIRDFRGAVVETSREVESASGANAKVLVEYSHASDADSMGRFTKTTYLDGTSTLVAYSPCCGQVESRTDAEGNVTAYTYDPLGRLSEVTSNFNTPAAVTLTYEYNIANEVTGIRRGGTYVSGTGYDSLGRRIFSRDALDNFTFEAEAAGANGHRIFTTTSPDPDGPTGPLVSPTRIEDRHLDGRTYSISGEGTSPVRYEYGLEQETDSHYLGLSDVYVQTVKQINVGAAGATTEWVKSYSDPLGRTYKQVYPDGSVERTYFGPFGTVVKQESSDIGVAGSGAVAVLHAQGHGTAVAHGVGTLPTSSSLDWVGGWRIVALDLNQNGQIDFATDRIERQSSWYEHNTNDGDVRVSSRRVWTTAGNATTTVEQSRQVAAVDGSESTSFAAGQFAGSAVRIFNVPDSQYGTLSTNVDGTQVVMLRKHGRQVSVTTLAKPTGQSAGDLLSVVEYGYDAFGRPVTTRDTRLTDTVLTDDRTTMVAYDAADRVVGSTISGPSGSQTTTLHLDNLGRVYQTDKPDGSSVFTVYTSAGQIAKSWGSGGSDTYPTEYTYDTQGRMKTLKTWKQFNAATGTGLSGSAVTTWNYDAARGWLTSKTYQGGSAGPSYQYYPSGMLKRRTWGRGIYTQYTYTAGGKPAMVNYSDTTPDVTYTYDRIGRVATITDGIGIRSIAFNDLGQPLSEDFTAGILDPVKIENTYDTMGRRTQNTLLVNTQQRNAVAFGYEDLTGRLSTVTKNTTRRARYAYTPGAPGQVQAVVHESFASNAWQATDTGTRVYDGFERLTSIGWTTGTGNNQATVASFAYLYNTANERTRTTLADGSYWQYVYDDLGQVSSGKRYSSTGAPIPGQQFEYTFDDIGNRTQAKAGGDASGNNLRTATYTSNLLNMYTGRGSPGIVDIMGYAPMASYPVSITTGGSTVPADFRLLEYYQKKVSWTNTAAARFEQVLVESDPTHAGSEKELWVFLPKDPEAFTHDVDGNLLQDGRWNYGWDGENRLIWMESRTDLPTAMPRQRVEFGYDFMSRRNVKRMYIPVAVAEAPGGPLGEPETIGATTSVIDGATASVAGPGSDAAAESLPAWAVSAPVGWSQVGLSKYVWDGWNLLAELDITDASVRTFAWGLDLSGSEQGAGGIGGLVLGWTRANGTLGGEVNGTGGNTLRYVFDGNGNVMAALDDLGRARAKYEYGPFGETLTSEGDLAADNPIRWSTKYTDGESGLVYYGYRYYNAGTGRWLNRDPIGERGGMNLQAFVSGAPTNQIDARGQYGAAGHLYTTFIAARCAGLSVDEADVLAFYSQLPDELETTDAFTLVTNYKTDWSTGQFRKTEAEKVQRSRWMFRVTRELHSLTGGYADLRRQCLLKLLGDPTLTLAERGVIIHALGDAYAHVWLSPSGVEVLYLAPDGHGLDSVRDPRLEKYPHEKFLAGQSLDPASCHTGRCPDFIANYPARHRQYFMQLCQSLGGSWGRCVMCSAKLPIPQISPRLEDISYLQAAVEVGYPSTGFVPTGKMDPKLNQIDTQFSYTNFIDSVISKIQKACCYRGPVRTEEHP